MGCPSSLYLKTAGTILFNFPFFISSLITSGVALTTLAGTMVLY